MPKAKISLPDFNSILDTSYQRSSGLNEPSFFVKARKIPLQNNNFATEVSPESAFLPRDHHSLLEGGDPGSSSPETYQYAMLKGQKLKLKKREIKAINMT